MFNYINITLSILISVSLLATGYVDADVKVIENQIHDKDLKLKGDFFPVISIPLSGKKVAILKGVEIIKIELEFIFKQDEDSFNNLIDEIKYVSLITKTNSNLFLYGKVIDNKLLVQNWYILSPFSIINSVTEGSYDPSKTTKKIILEQNDFNKKWKIFRATGAKIVPARKVDLNRHIIKNKKANGGSP